MLDPPLSAVFTSPLLGRCRTAARAASGVSSTDEARERARMVAVDADFLATAWPLFSTAWKQYLERAIFHRGNFYGFTSLVSERGKL
uniref:Uncharacterized protein n=1 Tax=Arundo donax TaxID=35708 RepID=A0A0A9EM96_ARUDO